MPAIATKERPLTLTAAEVLAIQSDYKTVLRRPVSASNSTVCGYRSRQLWGHLLWESEIPAPVFVDSGFPNSDGVCRYAYLHVPARHPEDPEGWEKQYRVRCLWDPGDRFWCRETAELVSVCGYNVSGARMELRYRADGARRHFDRDAFGSGYDNGGRLFGRAVYSPRMPRWASRLTLEVESVGVEGRWEWVVEVRQIEA